MIKLYRNIPSLHRFVELAPLASIRTLIAAHGNDEQTQAFATFAWPTDAVLNGASQSFRLGVLAICAALDAKQSAPLDGHARRIITLSEGKGIEAVQAVRSNLYRHDDAQQSIADEYVAQPDHFGRATVIYLRAPDLFSEAEQYFYAEHHRNYGRLYEAYDLDCDDAIDFEWTEAKQSELEILLHERLGTIGRCLIQYLPFEQKSASGETSTAHLFLIRHAGEMNSVQQVCDDLSSAPYYYRAPVEATLLFQPEKKSIEVFAAPDVNRFLIASSFSAVGVNADLSGRPVSMRQYNLRRFYRSLSLPQEPVAELGDEPILAVARQTGLLQAVIAVHPKGLQQEIFEGGSGLSGGQRQLVNLTRAFLRRPTLWLLDEPTASMDRGLELQVTQALKAAIRPTDTLALVTHKGEMLELVERVIVIANQQVVLDGPKAQVLQKLQTPPGAAPNTRAA